MIEESELVNFLASIAATLVIVTIANKIERGKLSFFYTGLIAMLIAYIVTILEGFLWRAFFNLVEHFALAAAGVLFAIGCWHLGKPSSGNDME